MNDRRLIEERFPVREVGEESAYEKTIRQGHISALHIWWARRPLASSRATAYAALMPVSKNEEDWQEKKGFIVRLSKWQNSQDLQVLEKARNDILGANKGNRPKVLDLFAGGGAIPLEALRLGCDVYARDYNPVAVLILKCTLEYPQKYGETGVKEEHGLVSHKQNSRFLNTIEKLGEWVLEETKQKVEKFYEEDKNGSYSIAYIWVRTINCQNPSCNAEIPLMRSYWLAKRRDRKVSLYPYIREKEVRFRIVGTGYEKTPKNFDQDNGTISRAVATCLVCGSTVDAEDTRMIFARKQSGERLVAVVSGKVGLSGKTYRTPSDEDFARFKNAEVRLSKERKQLQEKWGIDPVPDESLPPAGTLGFRVQRYGKSIWGDLFNSRQKLAMIIFADAVRRTYDKMLSEGEEQEYAKAVTEILALTFDKLADLNNSLCRWEADVESPRALFARQIVPIVWDFAETNPTSGFTGSWQSMLKRTIDALKSINLDTSPATITQGSATSLPYAESSFDAVFTDPPYYDNVPYSHLSDFFYVWLKRTIGELEPELFATPLTPKKEEIVAYPNVQGGIEGGKKFFEEMLKKSFIEINRVLKPNGIAVIVYAHKSTAGWETLVNSLLDSGLVVTAAWPIHTEMGSRLRAVESAALASSIYMVARKINKEDTGFYREVKDELTKYLNEKLDRLWTEGISGPDFFIAAIGSSIEVFGKYDKIIDDEGIVIRADRLLEDVRRIVTDYAVRQVLHNGFAAEISQLTRFYILWRWAYGDAKVEFDEARKLAQSVGIDLTHEWNKGFIAKDKEFISVLGPEDRGSHPLDRSGELIDVLHNVVLLWKKGRSEDIVKVLKETGFGNSDVFYRVSQAISESLPNTSKEKRLLEGFLSGRERISNDVRTESAQRRLFE